MNYLNIHTDVLKSEEFIGAEPVQRATWLSLMAWCATQENGGKIKQCADWGDRKWLSICGVTSAEVKTACGLFSWEADCLALKFYPIEAEKAVKAKRQAGKMGGRPKGSKSKPKPAPTQEGNHMVNHEVKQSETMTETKRKEKEGKEMERNGTEGNFPCPQADEKALLLEIWNLAPSKSRTRSSKKKVFDAWRRVPKSSRPTPLDLITAIKAWASCEDWTKDGGQFAPGLHLWIKDQKWEDLPEGSTPITKPTHDPGPEGWQKAHQELYPDWLVPFEWFHVELWLRDEIQAHLNDQ